MKSWASAILPIVAMILLLATIDHRASADTAAAAGEHNAVTTQNTSRRLRVIVRGLRLGEGPKGMLRAALFLQGRGFPDDAKAAASHASLDLEDWAKRVAAAGSSPAGAVDVTIELELPHTSGTSTTSDEAARSAGSASGAVTLFHDANRNGVLDKGLFGIPREGFGFSANPTIWKGAPAFEDCRVSWDASRPEIVVSMVYLMGAVSSQQNKK